MKLGLLAFVGFVVIAGVAFALWFPGWVRETAVEEARKRGVELELGEVSLRWGSATLTDCKFRLTNVRGLSGSVKRVELTLDGLDPKAIDAEGVTVNAVGSAADLAIDLSQWAHEHRKAFSTPVTAKGVDASWRTEEGGKEWLAIKGGGIAPLPGGGGVFTAKDAQVAGLSLGKVGASWTSKQARVVLGFGAEDAQQAPILVDLRKDGDTPTADITLEPMELKRLSDPFGVKLPVDPTAKASGSVHLELPVPPWKGKVKGTLKAKLDGWTPPHPRELNGYFFGNSSTFETKLELSDDYRSVVLTDSIAKTGAIKLKGGGNIQRKDDHAIVRMSLRGDLGCADLADAAAKTHLGTGAVGKIVGGLAKQNLKGSVGVVLTLEADSRKLDEAKVLKTIGIGCGLRPLSLDPADWLEDWKNLPGLDELPPLPKGVPPLGSARPGGSAKPPAFELPPIPSGFPPFGRKTNVTGRDGEGASAGQ